jgi:hypothetical protein
VVEIDTDGELVMPAEDSQHLLPDTDMTEDEDEDDERESEVTLNLNKDAGTGTHPLPPPPLLVDVDLRQRGLHPSTSQTDCTHQVPIREYLEQTLRNLHEQRLVAAAPSCLGDNATNSLQVRQDRVTHTELAAIYYGIMCHIYN